MVKKTTEPVRESWNAASLEAVAPPTPETLPPDDNTWAAYRALVARESLTDGELARLATLGQQVGRSPEQAELDHIVLAEVEQLETLLAQEPAIMAADVAAEQADQAAFAALEKQIRELACRLRDRDFPERAAHLAARAQVALVNVAGAQIGSTKARWPALFGLPAGERWNSEQIPDAVMATITKLNLTNHDN